MMAIFTFPLWIFIARTFDRFGKGIRTSARDAMLSDEATPENKGKVFGFHRSMDTVGAAIGPVIALVFLYFYPEQYKWLFFIAFLPGIAAIMLTLFLKDKPAVKSSHVADHASPGINDPPVHRINFFSYFKYWGKSSQGYKLLVAGLLIFTLFNSSDAFLLLALKNQGMSDTRMIGFYIFYNLVYAALSYPIGAMADKFGLKTMLIAGFLVFSGVYFCFGFAASTMAFGVLFLFYGIYSASTEGISKALISNMAAKTDTATAIGFYNSFASIFTLVASTMAGLLWYSIGPKSMFMISGLGVMVVSIYLFVVLKRKQEQG
jgi:MFS family permease